LQPAHAQQLAVVKRLIRARQQHPALRSDTVEFYVDNFAAEHVVRLKRWAAPGERDYATVALNFGGDERTVVLEVPWPGEWYDAVHDRTHRVRGGKVELCLPPWSGVLLVAS
jgi:1,4-alpha-glucan branching enzyme